MEKKLKTKERREIILNKLNQQKEVSVGQLSKEFEISVVTIRKDLEALEQAGLLERVHGGAVLDYNAAQNQGFAEKLVRNKFQKLKIAAYIGNMISRGESVLLNSGTTPYYIAQELKRYSDLIIITNSFQVLNEIGNCKNLSTIFLGGQFDPDTQLTHGEDVIAQLKKYKVNKAFISVDGISIDQGATTYSPIARGTHRQMLQCADEKYLVADDSKLGRVALVHIADLEEFDAIITNRSAKSENFIQLLMQHGIHVIAI